MKRVLALLLPSCLAAGPGLRSELSNINNTTSHVQHGRETQESAEQMAVTYFIYDGLQQGVFQDELAKGNLPHLSSLITDGTYIQSAIASFPSMTGYAFYPLLTGEDAALSGIGGLRWFDRRREKGNLRTYVGAANVNMNEDIRSDRTLVFEAMPADRTSKTALSYMNRGAQDSYIPGLQFATSKYRETILPLKWFSMIPILGPMLVPTLEELEVQVTDNMIEDLEQNNPGVHWITFASTDTDNHLEGTTEHYRVLMRNIDTQIGRYIAAARASGHHANRLYVVGTDHGTTDIQRNLNLANWFEDSLGIPAIRGCSTTLTAELDQPLSELSKEEVYVVINGNTMNYLYFKGSNTWKSPLSYDELRAYPTEKKGNVDIIQELRTLSGIEFVITAQTPDEILIFSPSGQAVIRKHTMTTGRASAGGGDPQPELRLSYEATTGSNPLGYDSQLFGTPLTEKEWLDQTYTTNYPYAPVRLFRLFSGGVTGEVVVTAALGYDLAMDYELIVNNYRGGHGGIRADQTRVPYILSGPTIQPGNVILTATFEDVGATLIQALQFPIDNPLPKQLQIVKGNILSSALRGNFSTAPPQ